MYGLGSTFCRLAESSEINICLCLNYLDRFIMRYICICPSHVFLCVFHYIASYFVNNIGAYMCKTLSFKFNK